MRVKQSHITTSGLPTQQPISSDVEVYAGRIVWHGRRLLKPGVSGNERLTRLRSIISAAQDAYDSELARMDALNSLKADPQLEAPIV